MIREQHLPSLKVRAGLLRYPALAEVEGAIVANTPLLFLMLPSRE